MKTPSPFIPQGSLLAQSPANRNHLRIAFFIVAIHLVFFGGLLMQGCKKESGVGALDDPSASDQQLAAVPPDYAPVDDDYYSTIDDLGSAATTNSSGDATGPESFSTGGTGNTAGTGIGTGSSMGSGSLSRPYGGSEPGTGSGGGLQSNRPGSSGVGTGTGAATGTRSASNGTSPSTGTGTGSDASNSYFGMSSQGTGTASATTGGSSPRPAAPAMREHTIARGDSFYKLARKYGVPLKAIQAANPGLNPRRILPGQTVQIPAAKPASPTRDALDDAGDIYVVRKGDTLTTIARKHNTSIKLIKAMNNLRTDRILVGQKLVMPGDDRTEAPTSSVGYVQPMR